MRCAKLGGGLAGGPRGGAVAGAQEGAEGAGAPASWGREEEDKGGVSSGGKTAGSSYGGRRSFVCLGRGRGRQAVSLRRVTGDRHRSVPHLCSRCSDSLPTAVSMDLPFASEELLLREGHDKVKDSDGTF